MQARPIRMEGHAPKSSPGELAAQPYCRSQEAPAHAAALSAAPLSGPCHCSRLCCCCHATRISHVQKGMECGITQNECHYQISLSGTSREVLAAAATHPCPPMDAPCLKSNHRIRSMSRKEVLLPQEQLYLRIEIGMFQENETRELPENTLELVHADDSDSMRC